MAIDSLITVNRSEEWRHVKAERKPNNGCQHARHDTYATNEPLSWTMFIFGVKKLVALMSKQTNRYTLVYNGNTKDNIHE